MPGRRTPPLGSLPSLPPLGPAPARAITAPASPPVKEAPPGGTATLARVATRPEAIDLTTRVELLEHALARLVALLAHDTRDTAGQLARLAEELQAVRRTRTNG